MILPRLALVVALALTSSHAAAMDKPRHIMSLNVCTDELLLDLVPPDRIASVTVLSRLPSNSYLWPQAARVPVNHGSAEEVLAQKPDFVLAGTYTTAVTRTLLKRLGTPMLEVGLTRNFYDIRAVTRQVARALGEPARGEALLRRMDATLRDLAATRPRRTIRVAGWDGGVTVPGKGTLFDAILTAAGGTNIAATTYGEGGSFDVEQLLMARPDILANGGDDSTTPSLRADIDRHPLVQRFYARRRITYPEALYSCGVPQSADAARALRAGMLAAMANASLPP
jgi:iron complex transport system substrate-binding protein